MDKELEFLKESEKCPACGKFAYWQFLRSDRDGDWYEQTCASCGEKINLKCVLSDRYKF